MDSTVGGSIPKPFIPAVKQGAKEAVDSGVLVGYPVIGVKVTVHDGSFHAVDSSGDSVQDRRVHGYERGASTGASNPSGAGDESRSDGPRRVRRQRNG